MSTTAGLSKGVFVFKGKKKVAKSDDYFVGDDSFAEKERLAGCEDLLEKINMYMQVLQSELNSRLFEDLLTFIQGAQEGFIPGKGRTYGSQITREIPTAALVTGVNMPDHGAMFATLTSSVTERITPHVASVHSNDCPNVHKMMAKVVSQVMDNTDVEMDDTEEDVTVGKKVVGNMEVLSSWYAHVTKKTSPGKRRKSMDGKKTVQYPPVVVILEDLEGFPPRVLQDFVTISSDHLVDVPMVLVMGVATTVTAIHRLLPHAVSSHLSIERFQAPPAFEHLTQVLDQVIMTDDIPFKLGPKVFNLLLDIFLYHDFSVVSFVRGLQLALIDHFYAHPWAALCQRAEEALTHLQDMKQEQLDLLRAQKSFRRHVERCKPQEQIALLEDEIKTKKCMVEMVEDIHSYHSCYFPVLRCLHSLASTLPKYPLGKQLRELYASNLRNNLGDMPEYIQSMGLLKTLSRDELMLRLNDISTLLDNNDLPPELIDLRTSILEHLLKVAEIDQMAAEEEAASEPKPLLPKKMDMYTLKQKLQEMDKTKRLTAYEIVRNDCIEFLDKEVFRKYLVSPLSLPLHEVYYYDDVATIRRTISGSPRITIQNGLAKPYTYLEAEGCRCDTDIPPTLPDVCIAYKLHLECGRLINLYDWLQAYMMIMEAGADTDGRKKPSKTMQARFVRAVSELQFLGFIKPTKRKTDHVARLTWGGC